MWYWWVGEEKKSCAGKSQRHSLQNVRTWIQKVNMVGMINVGLAQMKKRKTISCCVTPQIARHGGSPCPKLIDFRWCGSARNACKSGYFRFCFEYRWSSAPRFFPDGDQGGELGDSPSQEKDKHGCFHSKLISEHVCINQARAPVLLQIENACIWIQVLLTWRCLQSLWIASWSLYCNCHLDFCILNFLYLFPNPSDRET